MRFPELPPLSRLLGLGVLGLVIVVPTVAAVVVSQQPRPTLDGIALPSAAPLSEDPAVATGAPAAPEATPGAAATGPASPAGPGATGGAGTDQPTGEGTTLVANPVVTWPIPAAEWLDRVAAGTGIPRVALRAYATAQLRLEDDRPQCHLGWTTLAGIGAIESGHGTHGGAHLLEDGTTSTPILGPALDGSSGFAAIPATPETTQWHGDPRWDHAVGPMQFIPSTWERWGSDGDGDGVRNPNDIDDAAFAAARYLCSAGGDVSTGDGWHRAVFAYNHSEEYVANVYARANAYAAAVAG